MIITLATSQNCPKNKKENRLFFDLKKHDLAPKKKKEEKQKMIIY
jgi:hypothetical protein